MRTRRRASLIAGLAIAVAACRPELVNVAEEGHGVIGSGVNDPPVISGDGRVIAFSTSDYLTAEDDDGTWDVYARDVRADDTALMSITPSGLQDYCGSSNPQISGDGRYVAWSGCTAPALVPPPPGTIGTRVYVKDRVTGEMENVGIPEELGFGGGGFGFLDHDGSHVVTGCHPEPAVVEAGVCVHDRAARGTTVVSRRTDGALAPGFSVPTSITDDGRKVAFTASVANVVPGSTDTRGQLFVHDTSTGVTTPVTVDPAVLPGDVDGRISGDGTAAVLWQEAAPNRIVHKNLETGEVRRIDRHGCADVAPSSTYGWASISDDGDVVAFQSNSPELVPHDRNGADDVFVWRTSNPCFVQRASLGPGFREGDGDSYWPAVSGDGRSVAFVSEATNLVPDDTNGSRDAFVVRIAPGRGAPGDTSAG